MSRHSRFLNLVSSFVSSVGTEPHGNAAEKKLLLYALQKRVVCLVRADPEPVKIITPAIRDGAVRSTHVGRPDSALLLKR